MPALSVLVVRRRDALQHQRAGLQARQLEEVVDHGFELAQLVAGAGQVLSRRLPALDDTLIQRLQHRPEGGQRGPQIVRDDLQQEAPRLLQFAPAGTALLQPSGQLVEGAT